MPLRTLILVNPRSRNGATGRRLDALRGTLRAVLGELEIEATRGPRDAERIAREAARAGVERIVIAGGDGTTSEVVTGLLAAGLGAHVRLALLPLGTGGDLVRALGVPRDVEGALARIAAGKERSVDAGRARYRDAAGHERESYFLNVASAGISGLVTALVNEAPKSLGGTLSFLIGTLRGIARHRAVPARVVVDGRTIHEGPLVLATAANGRYFGGGMHVAPNALLDDGLLDVTLIGGVSKLRLLRELPKLYTGAHLGAEAVIADRGRTIEITPLASDAGADPIHIELDGEPLGRAPVAFEVVPGAVTLLGVDA